MEVCLMSDVNQKGTVLKTKIDDGITWYYIAWQNGKKTWEPESELMFIRKSHTLG